MQVSSEQARAFTKVATQVAHDIRSPLSALNLMISCLTNIEEEKRNILKESAGRINDIANNLLSKSKKNTETLSRQLLPALIDSIVSEKRFEYRTHSNIRITLDLKNSYDIFCDIDPSQFKRIISNLLNNSVESLTNGGFISVTLEQNKGYADLRIQDTGSGISPEFLKLLGKENFTTKQLGTGIGLSHAQEMMELWNGRISVQSVLGQGTTILLSFKILPSPSWFLTKIKKVSQILSIDDDVSIHEIWKQRISGPKLFHFHSGEALEGWLSQNSTIEDSLFLFDYEFLDKNYNGLDLILKYKLQSKSVLVTSRYEDKVVRDTAAAMGVKILPKGLSPWVPIT